MTIAVALIAFFGTTGAALIGTLGVYVGKRMETSAAKRLKIEDEQAASVVLALDVLQKELDRKDGEISEQNTRIDRQAKDIADLRVSNWLVLEHLLDVHRHFAEGNPPPPPPIPQKLLEHLREG
jgi:hypothetical protein